MIDAAALDGRRIFDLGGDDFEADPRIAVAAVASSRWFWRWQRADDDDDDDGL